MDVKRSRMESRVCPIFDCHTSNDGDQYDEANQVIKRGRNLNGRARCIERIAQSRGRAQNH